MERPIKEDQNIADPALYLFIAITVFIMLFAFSLAAWKLHQWIPLLSGLGFAAILVVFSTVVIRSVHRDRAKPTSSWVMTMKA
jgi:NhaP-type Na+/H+ or K+/H+ antiporter